MNTSSIHTALTCVASKSAAATTSLEAQQYAQAALSLAHALASLEGINKGASNAPPYTIDRARMVDRFLSWALPEDFAPDAGISFIANRSPHCWPLGTNLLTAAQAREMFEHVLG